MKLLPLNLTAKIVLLVALMGTAASLVIALVIWQVQRSEMQYLNVLQTQGAAAYQIGKVRQHVGAVSVHVHAALSANTAEKRQQAQVRLKELQQLLQENLEPVYPMLQGHELTLDTVHMQAQQVFYAAQRAIAAASSAQEARAGLILERIFTPAQDKLQDDLSSASLAAQQNFVQSTEEISSDTYNAMRVMVLLGGLSLLLINVWAAWVALRHISQPISRLTRSMQDLSENRYGLPISDQERQDELGCMARTLQSFSASMQKAVQLEKEWTQLQHKQLLVDQLRELTSALPGAVFQMSWREDEPLKLRFASQQWAQLMGLQEEADTSTAMAAKMIRTHAAEAAAISYTHFTHSAQHLEPLDFDVSIPMLDGVTRWIKTRANPHQEADGSVTFNGVWMDVSKEVMQALALEKAKRSAEQVAQEKSTLQASISHEIRTPLNAILGLTQLLLKTALPVEQRQQLHSVLRASQHLRGIVNEVLDFSKIDAGQLQLESTDFSLHEVIQDVLIMCREAADAKHLALNYSIASDVPDSLRGDSHRIAQILLNYVNNAIKFTAAGSVDVVLRLDTASTLHRIVLHASVKDSGPGIPADRLPYLFAAFQQADNSITRRFGGTGLGLTISRALAHLMGGAAGVESQLGQGSTFWFTAVLEPARTLLPNSFVRNAVAPSPPVHWQGLRVLVVDDNPLNRTVAQGMLHAAGLSSDAAEDGEQALQILKQRGPHCYACVLMDIQMPQLDGLSTTRALRLTPGFEALPIIAMTAHTGLQDIERCHAAGMNNHLAKPLLENALYAVLHDSLPKAATGSSDTQTFNRHLTPPPAPSQSPETLPAIFDAPALQELAHVFNPQKLDQLVKQFSNDTLERTLKLITLGERNDWESLRQEAHKLTGTAATFGLLRLGHLSAALSASLKSSNTQNSLALTHSIHSCAKEGVAQLHAHRLAMSADH